MLLFLNALIFLACIRLINLPHPIVRIFIFTFLSVNALLSVTDQLGVLDFIFLSINILCIIGCAFYFKKIKA